MSIFIRQGEILKITYSVSTETNKIKNIVDVEIDEESKSDRINSSELFNDMNEIKNFTWKPQEKDVNGKYVFNIDNKEISVIVTSLPENTIANWPLIEETNSNIIKDYRSIFDGQLVGDAEFIQGDYLGSNAVKFNGSGRINIPHNDVLTGMNQFTIIATINGENFSSNGDHSIVAKYETNSNQRSYAYIVRDKQIQVLWSNDGDNNSSESTGVTVEENKNIRLAWTYDGTFSSEAKAEIYKNGEFKTDLFASPSGQVNDNTNIDLRIGDSHWTDEFEGIIDNVIITDTVLSKEEIKTDYNNQPWS